MISAGDATGFAVLRVSKDGCTRSRKDPPTDLYSALEKTSVFFPKSLEPGIPVRV
jgi:hypothetical protein